MPAKRPAKKVPAKKAPAKKATPRKKSAGQKKTKATATVFELVITNGGSVLVDGVLVTNRQSLLVSGSKLGIVSQPPPSGGSQSVSHISVNKRGTPSGLGFGFNMPVDGGKAKIIFDLSIFNKIERTEVPAIEAKSDNGTTFNTGIEG
jgi:hypothetical protein